MATKQLTYWQKKEPHLCVTPPNFETIKRLIKQKTQQKFSQEAIASSNKTQWQNMKSTWENNKNEPRNHAITNFWLNTGHDCLAAHLQLHQSLQPQLLHSMPTGEYNNGQRSPPCVPKTGPHLQRITKTVLGFQKTKGINPRSAIRKQQQHH
jgi:hypothetical protein